MNIYIYMYIYVYIYIYTYIVEQLLLRDMRHEPHRLAVLVLRHRLRFV